MDKLVVLWKDGDKGSAINMVFMYALNAKVKGWWKEVVFIIWGASTELTVQDEDIQNLVKRMIESGVNVRACKKCAENLNAVEKLEELGVDVLYVGQAFTEYLKDPEAKVITL